MIFIQTVKRVQANVQKQTYVHDDNPHNIQVC